MNARRRERRWEPRDIEETQLISRKEIKTQRDEIREMVRDSPRHSRLDILYGWAIDNPGMASQVYRGWDEMLEAIGGSAKGKSSEARKYVQGLVLGDHVSDQDRHTISQHYLRPDDLLVQRATIQRRLKSLEETQGELDFLIKGGQLFLERFARDMHTGRQSTHILMKMLSCMVWLRIVAVILTLKGVGKGDWMDLKYKTLETIDRFRDHLLQSIAVIQIEGSDQYLGVALNELMNGKKIKPTTKTKLVLQLRRAGVSSDVRQLIQHGKPMDREVLCAVAGALGLGEVSLEAMQGIAMMIHSLKGNFSVDLSSVKASLRDVIDDMKDPKKDTKEKLLLLTANGGKLYHTLEGIVYHAEDKGPELVCGIMAAGTIILAAHVALGKELPNPPTIDISYTKRLPEPKWEPRNY